MRRYLFAAIACAPCAFAAASGGCGGSTSSSVDAGPMGASDAFFDRSRLDAPILVDAPCLVTIDAPQLLPAAHVAPGSDIQWDSNPPSSGPHFPIWAAYQAYTQPVPRGYYVHDLEHGGVVLLYKCSDGGACADVAAALQRVSDALPSDPLCAGTGVRVRTVITPDPLLDVPIAAAAWGWVYKAQCLDLPSLTQFAKDHYAQGPEATCANGTTTF